LHLSPLERRGKVFVWADTEIKVGDQWRDRIRAAVLSAGAAVFLVSPAFLASDFINQDELPPLLEAAAANHVKVLWIHVSASMYKETSLSTAKEHMTLPNR
jgi:TIR domain